MFEVGIASDLYEAGKTEDGRPYIAEIYYAAVTSPNGRRWVSAEQFPGALPYFDEEDGIYRYEDTREEAQAAAQKIVTATNAILEAGGKLNELDWTEIDPVYGSKAYIEQDTELNRWMEERQDQY
jgi:hypothetical protein